MRGTLAVLVLLGFAGLWLLPRPERGARHNGALDAVLPRGPIPEMTTAEVAPLGRTATIQASETPARATRPAPPPPSTLSGTVHDPRGQPLHAWLIYVWSEGGRRRDASTWSGEDGHFELALPDAHARGDLLVSSPRDEWTPTARLGLAAGTRDLELTLGWPATFDVEVLDQDERPVPNASCSFAWELAGFPVEGPFRQFGGDGKGWPVSPLPFRVSVQSSRAESRWFGPFDSSEVGERLTLHVRRHPLLSGIVLHEGQPVPGARVWMERVVPSLSEGSVRDDRRPYGPEGKSDAEGRFELPARWPGRFVPRAFRVPEGAGRAESITCDGQTDLAGLVIQLDQPPGAIAGRVLLPRVHRPSEILLTASSAAGYRVLRPDGAFLLPNLPPGPCRLSVKEGDPEEEDSGERWLMISDGPTRGPAWLPQEFHLEVSVPAGGTAAVTFDLSVTPPCRLEGRVLPGVAFRSDEVGLHAGPPLLILDEGNEWDADGEVRLGDDGRFRLGLAQPGTKRLFLELAFPDSESEWSVTDRVELRPGTRTWNLAPSLGALRLLPADPERALQSGPELHWLGEGELGIDIRYPTSEETRGSLLYPRVPAGRVRFELPGEAGPASHEVEIRAGETTELRLPE